MREAHTGLEAVSRVGKVPQPLATIRRPVASSRINSVRIRNGPDHHAGCAGTRPSAT